MIIVSIVVYVAVVPVDYVADGFINAKDYAYIHRKLSGTEKTHYKSIFGNFINYTE